MVDEVFDPVAEGLTTEGYPGERKGPKPKVRGFDRLMQQTRYDQDTGARWESGEPIMRGGAGLEYTIKQDPDQRTLRTKIEEDIIPAVADWVDEPSLPSKEDMMQFGKEFVEATADSLEKTVSGTGTIGEAMEWVGGAGALGSVGRAPEDSLRMFIGRTANVDLSKLPESVGKDGKPRWEISDAGLEGVTLEPYNTHFKKSKKEIVEAIKSDLNDYGQFQGSTLESVLTHPELYKAYPSLADIPVVVDESLSEFVYGYVPGGNSPKFVAVNKKLLSDPEKFKNTLLHEVQHLVQDTEGFSPGTSTLSLSVLNKSPEVKKELDVEAIKEYEKNLEAFKKNQARRLKDRTPLDTAIKLVDILQEAQENKLGNNFSLRWNIDKLLKAEQEAKSFLDSADVSLVKTYGNYIETPLDDLERKIQFALEDFSSESEEFQNFIKEAIGVFPSEVKKYSNKSWSTTADFPNPLIENKLIREAPLRKPTLPSGFTSSLKVSDETYKRSAGETEARNTGQGRTELTLEQRKQIPPETTEDRPRKNQWLVEDYDSFSEGGLAVEEQMNKLYQEGGLADDGTDIEPVTGNEVPTGSMDQEVRDNIPAQLSEGEYVVPADVVRYYGVKFFEDLRGQAKQDFARMEAEGRVGGEPVDTNGMPMEEDVELTPEEMQMLAEALGQVPTGMAMGGMVPQQQPYDPYAQQQMQYTQPQPMFQSSRVGMQEGGMAQIMRQYNERTGQSSTPTTPSTSSAPEFNPSDWSYGGDFENPFGNQGVSRQGGMELVEYVNPTTGQTRMITVLDGEPIGLVPDGFIPASQEAKQEAKDAKQEVDTKTEGTRGTEFEPGGSGLGADGVGTPETAEISEMDPETLGKSHTALGKVGTALGMIAGPVAAAVPAAMQKAVEVEMEKQDIEVPEKQSLVEQVQDMLGIKSEKEDIGIVSEGEKGFAEAMAAAAPPGMSVSTNERGEPVGYSQSPSQAAQTAATPNAVSTAQEGIAAVSAARSGQASQGGGGVGVSTASPAEAAEAASTASAQATAQQGIDAVSEARGGSQSSSSSSEGDSGGDSDGGGKIVCTAMNTAYGFGSYRQAIWLKYSQEHMTKEHEIGYHKIFMPLVKKAYYSGDKNNMFIRKILENIARHRTADIRAETQGKKRDTIGRVYRGVLEPICFIVGKFSKGK